MMYEMMYKYYGHDACDVILESMRPLNILRSFYELDDYRIFYFKFLVSISHYRGIEKLINFYGLNRLGYFMVWYYFMVKIHRAWVSIPFLAIRN